MFFDICIYFCYFVEIVIAIIYFQKKILSHLVWNNETQEYQMRGVAYTGNNMKKRQKSSVENLSPVKFEMKQVYHKYPEKKREKLREKSAMIKTFSAIPKSR